MGTSVEARDESVTSQGQRVLALIRTKYPQYHPIMAIADLAHEKDIDDPKLKLDCHKTIAKYVQPELRSIDVKSQITETRRVIVSLFDEGDSHQKAVPDQALEGIFRRDVALGVPVVTVEHDPMWDMLIQEAA